MGLGGARLALLVLVLQTDLARKRKLTRGSFRWGGTEHWASSFPIQDDTDQLKMKSVLPIIVNFKTNIFARNIWSNEVCCEIRLWCPIRREWWAWLGECGIWDLGSGIWDLQVGYRADDSQSPPGGRSSQLLPAPWQFWSIYTRSIPRLCRRASTIWRLNATHHSNEPLKLSPWSTWERAEGIFNVDM